MKRRVFSYPYVLWMAFFVIIPLGLVMYFAFSNDSGALSSQSMAKAFGSNYLEVLLRSVYLALICTVICLVLGYPVGAILARSRLKTGVLIMLIMLPMWMNFLLRTYAWMALLDTNGLINTLLSAIGLPKARLLYNAPAIIVGMVYNYLPFMILPIYSVIIKIPYSLIEAAEDLGCNSRQVFRKITLPLSLPGIVSGITMVFMPAVSTFAISRLMGGSHFMMYGDLIETEFMTMQNWNFGSALSLIMMVFIFIAMAITSRVDSANEGGMII